MDAGNSSQNRRFSAIRVDVDYLSPYNSLKKHENFPCSFLTEDDEINQNQTPLIDADESTGKAAKKKTPLGRSQHKIPPIYADDDVDDHINIGNDTGEDLPEKEQDDNSSKLPISNSEYLEQKSLYDQMVQVQKSDFIRAKGHLYGFYSNEYLDKERPYRIKWMNQVRDDFFLTYFMILLEYDMSIHAKEAGIETCFLEQGDKIVADFPRKILEFSKEEIKDLKDSMLAAMGPVNFAPYIDDGESNPLAQLENCSLWVEKYEAESRGWSLLPRVLKIFILSKLPSQRLIRYKLVCKAWREVISFLISTEHLRHSNYPEHVGSFTSDLE